MRQDVDGGDVACLLACTFGSVLHCRAAEYGDLLRLGDKVDELVDGCRRD
jgi:hypothetical protein